MSNRLRPDLCRHRLRHEPTPSGYRSKVEVPHHLATERHRTSAPSLLRCARRLYSFKAGAPRRGSACPRFAAGRSARMSQPIRVEFGVTHQIRWQPGTIRRTSLTVTDRRHPSRNWQRDRR